jgi:DNA-binding beta-propeller fold protein YncE
MGNLEITMRTHSIILFWLALGAGIAALPGCDSDSPTGPRSEAPFTVISDDVFVVTARSGLTLTGEADSVLTFRMAGGIPKIQPGALLVGTEGGGYIRRVRSFEVDGGRLFVHTGRAFLSDAISAGEIDTTITFSFSSSARGAPGQDGAVPGCLMHAVRGVSFAGDGLNLSDVILYSRDAGGFPLTVSITEGRIEFDPEVGLFARMGLIGLDQFRATAEGDLKLVCDAKFATDGKVGANVEFSAPVATLRKTFIQHVGPVPVVEVVTMSFVAGFTVTPGFTGESEVGIQAAGPVRFGLEYSHRGWSDVLSASPEFAMGAFRYESDEEARITFSIRPSFTVDFYGLPSAAFDLGPSWGLSELNMGFPVLEWEVWAGMSGSTSFDAGALDEETRTYGGALSCCEATLGSGPFRTDAYVFVTQWGGERIVWDGTLYYPKGIAVDRAGDIYVTDNWNNVVKKFTADGEVLLWWGGAGSGDGQFDSPEKIAVDEDGYVYVVDGGNNRVQKFTADGAFVTKWGSAGSGDGEFNSPAGIAVGGGLVYVTDAGNYRVQVFSTSGDYRGGWGTYGSSPGQFDGPAGIAVVPGTGAVLVADCHNSRIQYFDAGGLSLASWGSYGTGDDQFNCPADVAVSATGAVFIADLGNDRFVQRTHDGMFVTKLGTPGTAEGQFDHPEAIAVDGSGNVYVVDSRNRRIQKFAPRIALRSSSGVVTGLSPN